MQKPNPVHQELLNLEVLFQPIYEVTSALRVLPAVEAENATDVLVAVLLTLQQNQDQGQVGASDQHAGLDQVRAVRVQQDQMLQRARQSTLQQ